MLFLERTGRMKKVGLTSAATNQNIHRVLSLLVAQQQPPIIPMAFTYNEYGEEIHRLFVPADDPGRIRNSLLRPCRLQH